MSKLSSKNKGIIYFVEEKDLLGYSTPNYVKIGLVKDNLIGRSAEDRKDEHQTGNPRPLFIAHSMETKASVSKLESLIHQNLAIHRHRGEWFVKPNGELKPFIEKSNFINNQLENQIASQEEIDALNVQISDEELANDNDESKEIHSELNRVINLIKQIEYKKKEIELNFEIMLKSKKSEIEGVCGYVYKKESSRFDSRKFAKDNPELFKKYSIPSISGNFRLQKIKSKNSNDAIEELNNKLTSLDKQSRGELILRTSKIEELHHDWLTLISRLQPLELEKDTLINRLKIICGVHSGIKNICSWKRTKSQKLSKNDLKDLDDEILSQYIIPIKANYSFSIRAYRPYKFQ